MRMKPAVLSPTLPQGTHATRPSLLQSIYEAVLYYDSGEALMKDETSRIKNSRLE